MPWLMPVFSDREVICVGAPICLVLATDALTARTNAKYVESQCIRYEPLPAIISFEEAIENKNVMPIAPGKAPDPTKKVIEGTRHGSNEEWLCNSSIAMPGQTVLTGTMRPHAQAHFYMETLVVLALPGSHVPGSVSSFFGERNWLLVKLAKMNHRAGSV